MQSVKNNAFTLIELLVVIAIIALLASIVLVALNGARVKARDAKRIADLQQIQTALELYYDDNGSYPIASCGSDGYGSCWTTFMPNSYIASMPNDPLNSSGYAYYYSPYFKPTGPCTFVYTTSGVDYVLQTRLESPASITNSCSGTFDNFGNQSLNYQVGE